MTYHLGVDLGATITTAAVHRAGRARVVLLGEHSAAMPSVLLWPEQGSPLVGEAAIRAAADAPGRVARDIRARLTDPAPFLLDGAPFAASALLGVLLRRVVDLTAEREGGAPDAIVLTHPATWGPEEREAFAGVAASLGLGAVELVPAPVAAAVAHAAEHAVGEGAAVAVVEVGGGRVDATVLRQAADSFAIVGTPVGEDGEPPVADVLRRALAGAGVAATDLDSVLLVGRSTRMGSSAAALADDIGRPVATGPEPEHAVVAGAAHLAARRSDAMTCLAPVAMVGAAPRPRPVVAARPVTGPVREAPAPAAVPAPGPAPRPRRRGLLTVLATAAIVLGGLGGGAYALVGAAAPAEAAPPAVVPAQAVPAPPATTTTTTTTSAPAPRTAAVASTSTERTTPQTRETPRRPRSTTSSSSNSTNSSSSSGSSSSSNHGTGSHDTTDTDHGETDHGDDTGTTPAGDSAPTQAW